MGGLIAANSIGIMGAKAGTGMAKSFGGWVGEKAKQRGLFVAGKAVGNDKMKEWTKKLSEGGIIGRLASRSFNYVGMKTEKATQKSYDDEIKDYKGPRLENEILASRGARRAALINKAVKDKDLSEKVRKEVLSDPDSIENIENNLKMAGYKPDGFTKLIGYNSKILKAAIKGNADELKKATDEFYDKFEQKDWSNIAPSSLIDHRLGKAITESMLIRSTGSLAKIMPKFKKQDDIKAIRKQVEGAMNSIKVNPEIDDDIKNKIEKAVDRHLAARITGPEADEEKKVEEKEEKK
jgi:soluble cytochrome b562